MGVSGGEIGALTGPSLMPGGDASAWEQVKPMLESISAKAQDGTPCVAWMGKGGAGQYVKMVHNGIEYGDMQLIAEVYDLLHRGAGISNGELAEIFAEWNEHDLQSCLIETTPLLNSGCFSFVESYFGWMIFREQNNDYYSDHRPWP